MLNFYAVHIYTWAIVNLEYVGAARAGTQIRSFAREIP